MTLKKLFSVLSLFALATLISCKKETDFNVKNKKNNDTLYSEATVDTTGGTTKETLLQKLDYAIWSMGNLEEYFQDKLSKATSKTQGNEIYDVYRENIEGRIETINELETDFIDNYPNYYVYEKKEYVFPDSIQKHIDLLKSGDMEVWELGEGNAEIRFKPDHYYKIFKGKVTEDYDYYLKTEAKENSVLYSADAGLLISFEDVSKRVLSWEKFRVAYPKSPLLEKATKKYQEYGYDYLFGIENTSTFEYDDGSFNEENKKEFKRFIAKNPDSNFAQIVKRFLENIKLKYTIEQLDEFVKKELNIIEEKEPDTP